MTYTEAKSILDKMRNAYRLKYDPAISSQMFNGMTQLMLIEFMVGLLDKDRIIKLIEEETNELTDNTPTK